MKVLIQCLKGAGRHKRLIRGAAKAALEDIGSVGAELSVLLTDDTGIRGLNRQYRGIDRVTDVLSFPQNDAVVLGDVVISIETAARQAEENGVGLDEEIARLLMHGILHLKGYEHEKGGLRARRMREKEERLFSILRKKGVI